MSEFPKWESPRGVIMKLFYIFSNVSIAPNEPSEFGDRRISANVIIMLISGYCSCQPLLYRTSAGCSP